MPAIANEIVELHLGVTPDAGVSGAVCLQSDRATFLTFNAMRAASEAGTAVVEFKRCIVSKFGYPNDEARWRIPQYKGVAYGIYEVRNSTWIQDVVRMNRYRFPNTTDAYVAKHFLFAFHDDTFECLADDLTLEVVQEPYQVTFERIRRRLAGT